MSSSGFGSQWQQQKQEGAGRRPTCVVLLEPSAPSLLPQGDHASAPVAPASVPAGGPSNREEASWMLPKPAEGAELLPFLGEGEEERGSRLQLRLSEGLQCSCSRMRSTPGDDESLHCSSSNQGPCIPSLPDDVVLDILARAPASALSSFRHVSRAWHAMTASEALRRERAEKGKQEQWLFVLPELPAGGPFRALDPQGATWHVLPPIPVVDPAALQGFACVAVSGKLLVIGGFETVQAGSSNNLKTVVTSSVWEFDPLSWRWQPGPRMGTARAWCAAGVLSDRYVYVTGGQGRDRFLKSVEVFDAVERRWWALADMRLARCSHKVAVVEGKVLVIAGELERHDPLHGRLVGNARQLPGNFPHNRLAAGGGAANRQQQQHQQGGLWQGLPVQVGQAQAPVPSADGNASMEVYDEVSDTWTLVPDSWISGSKVPCPVATVGGRLFAVHHSSVHVWDRATATWQFCGEVPGRDSYCRPCQVSGQGCADIGGQLALFGGSRDVWSGRSRLSQQHLSSVYTWDPRPVIERPQPEQGTAGAPHVRRLEPRHTKIMLWKELPSMAGAGGHILASAVVAV